MSDFVAGACVFAAGVVFGYAVCTLTPVITESVTVEKKVNGV